jgi:hypothetical protein
MCEANAATTPDKRLAIALGPRVVPDQPTSIDSENLAAGSAVANPHGLNEFLVDNFRCLAANLLTKNSRKVLQRHEFAAGNLGYRAAPY